MPHFSSWRVLHIPEHKLVGAKRPLPPRKFVYQLPHTDTVYVAGNVNVRIIGNQGRNRLIIRNTYDGRNADIKFFEGSLYIGNNTRTAVNAPRKNIEVIFYSCGLRRLFVSGNNCVCGQNIADACGMELITCGGGSVCLNGPTHIKRIVNTGNTIININQVATDHLHIVNTCAGQIKLTGCTGLLLVRAFGVTLTDARCLRAETGFVQAGNSALVLVRVRQNLRAFASGFSNIYYYTTPVDLVQHNTGSGNILQFGNWF